MIELCQSVSTGPAHEVAAVAPKRLCAGQPGVEIALARGGECQLVCGEPIQQRDSGCDIAFGGRDLPVGGVGVADAAAQPADDMPDRRIAGELVGDDPPWARTAGP